jgi:hypothetical protein
MPFSPRKTDRRVSMVFYAGFGGVALWAGIVLINYSLDSKFYNDYLLKWEVALRAYNQESTPWPYFSGGNHVEYMEKVTQLMRSKALSPPASNTERPYVYRLDRIGDSEEDIFLLCFSQKIILYGISSKTFDRLDAQIDGRDGTKKGHFTGRLSKDGYTYVGLWLI